MLTSNEYFLQIITFILIAYLSDRVLKWLQEEKITLGVTEEF